MSDLTRRDDRGQPMDVDVYARLLEKEFAAELRVERVTPPADNLVAFAVRDRAGRVRGMLALEWDAMEMDLPERLLSRVARAADSHPRPDLKLVG